jgi:hypothetical protein
MRLRRHSLGQEEYYPMAVVAPGVVREEAEPRLSDSPSPQLHLIQMPAAAERAWPAWIVFGSIVGALAGLAYVVAAA